MSKSRILIFAILLIFLCPQICLAWGPVVHLREGLYLLENTKLIISTIGEIILRYPYYFLYGCISPDIFIGKGKKISKTHSHNWDTGFKLISSNDLNIKSYGYGYLTHLAADVIAHNFFIPNMLQLYKLNRGKFFHILIEGIVDAKININKDVVKDLLNIKLKKADKVLLKIVRKNKGIFFLKKMVFKKGLNFNLQKINISNYRLKIEKKIDEMNDYIEDMIMLSRRAEIDLLNNLSRSQIVNYDPMGFKNLKIAQKSNRLFFKARYKGVVPFFVPSISLLNM